MITPCQAFSLSCGIKWFFNNNFYYLLLLWVLDRPHFEQPGKDDLRWCFCLELAVLTFQLICFLGVSLTNYRESTFDVIIKQFHLFKIQHPVLQSLTTCHRLFIMAGTLNHSFPSLAGSDSLIRVICSHSYFSCNQNVLKLKTRNDCLICIL